MVEIKIDIKDVLFVVYTGENVKSEVMKKSSDVLSDKKSQYGKI